MSTISTNNLTKIYGSGDTAVTALDHVSITVEPGQFVAVMGPSGCGKSTLLHLLGGLDRPTEGTVSIEDIAIAGMSDDRLTELRRRKIGFVFQFYNLIPVMTAVENAALPVTLDGVKPADAQKKAAEWLAKFGLSDRLRSRPDQLSGGQQQRVAVARALAPKPDFILADEPTANLDSASTANLLDIMARLNEEEHITFIFSTHDQRVISRARRVITLVDGKVDSDVVTG